MKNAPTTGRTGCRARHEDDFTRHRDELAPVHVWMAPAWQEITSRAAQKSLAVMCPACSRSPDGLLALMESANRGGSDDPALTHPTTGIPACCAPVPSGHALSSNGASSSRCSGPAEK